MSGGDIAGPAKWSLDYPPSFDIYLLNPASELVAQTDARVVGRDPVVDVRSGVVGSKNETTGETTGLLRIGYARVEIDVPCKPPVDGQREHIQRSAATRRGGTEGGAGRRLSGVSCGPWGYYGGYGYPYGGGCTYWDGYAWVNTCYGGYESYESYGYGW